MHTEKYFTLSNDMMFSTVLAANPELAKKMIELILDIPIDHVVCVNAQQIMNYSIDTKNVRFDVFVKDAAGIVYDVEMQASRTREKFLPLRARYYASAADTEIYKPGTKYKDMKEVVIIFLCLFDPFDSGLIRYTAKTCCAENPNVMLDDRRKVVYLDAKSLIHSNAGISSQLASLLNYIGGKDYEPTPLTSALQSEVEKYNKDKTWRQNAMRLESYLEDFREEGREEGREQGREQGREEGREQGLKEGREEGRTQGLAEGRDKALEEVAFRMFEIGKEDEEILRIVPWAKEQLAEKRKEWEENRG